MQWNLIKADRKIRSEASCCLQLRWMSRQTARGSIWVKAKAASRCELCDRCWFSARHWGDQSPADSANVFNCFSFPNSSPPDKLKRSLNPWRELHPTACRTCWAKRGCNMSIFIAQNLVLGRRQAYGNFCRLGPQIRQIFLHPSEYLAEKR